MNSFERQELQYLLALLAKILICHFPNCISISVHPRIYSFSYSFVEVIFFDWSIPRTIILGPPLSGFQLSDKSTQ